MPTVDRKMFTVNEYMTRNPVMVDGDERASSVAELMVKQNLKRVVVKTEKGYTVASARLLVRDALITSDWADRKISSMVRHGFWVSPDVHTKVAAREMVNNFVGSLLVLEGSKLVGIITERDIVRSSIHLGIPVEAFMTKHVEMLGPDVTMREAAIAMAHFGYSNLPIHDGTEVKKILTIRDALRALVEGRLDVKVLGCDCGQKPITVTIDYNFSKVKDLIMEKSVDGVLVTKSEESKRVGDVVGIVTMWDMVRTYANSISAHVMLEVELPYLEDVKRELSKLPRVTSFTTVFGEYDVIVRADAESLDALTNLVMKRMGAIKGVKKSVTMIEAPPTV